MAKFGPWPLSIPCFGRNGKHWDMAVTFYNKTKVVFKKLQEQLQMMKQVSQHSH